MLADSRRTLEASVKVRPDDAVVEVYRETPVAHTISSDGYLLAEGELVEVKQTEGESWWASDVIRTLRQSTPNEIGGQQRVDVRQVPPVLIDF